MKPVRAPRREPIEQPAQVDRPRRHVYLERDGWTLGQFLHHLAELEVEERRQRRVSRNLKQSDLPLEKTLARDVPGREPLPHEFCWRKVWAIPVAKSLSGPAAASFSVPKPPVLSAYSNLEHAAKTVNINSWSRWSPRRAWPTCSRSRVITTRQSKKTIVFVYARSCEASATIACSRALAHLGEARSWPRFTLAHLGGFPAMTEGGTTRIVGELFEVDAKTLARLDVFEGVPTLYERKRRRTYRGRVRARAEARPSDVRTPVAI